MIGWVAVELSGDVDDWVAVALSLILNLLDLSAGRRSGGLLYDRGFCDGRNGIKMSVIMRLERSELHAFFNRRATWPVLFLSRMSLGLFSLMMIDTHMVGSWLVIIALGVARIVFVALRKSSNTSKHTSGSRKFVCCVVKAEQSVSLLSPHPISWLTLLYAHCVDK